MNKSSSRFFLEFDFVKMKYWGVAISRKIFLLLEIGGKAPF